VPHTEIARAQELFVQSVTLLLCSRLATVVQLKNALMADSVFQLLLCMSKQKKQQISE
jgi:hypothetical protein